MKYSIYFLVNTIIITNIFSTEFTRKLPDQNVLRLITKENFKNQDAVIILKEQSYQIADRDIYYKGARIYGKTTTTRNILVVKILNQAAINRYGTFEFEYHENFGNELPNGFDLKLRILKSDQSIWEMPDDNVQNIVSRRNRSGNPIARKVLFKIPNLEVGDVLQIEYQFDNVLARSYSGLFFYHDRDFILYSNLYITLPYKDDINIVSFPKAKIGEPEVAQVSETYGSGKTYFWSMRNLPPIPDEINSRPFTNLSYMTAFYISDNRYHKRGSWENLAVDFMEHYMDEDDIDSKEIIKLGFQKDREQKTVTMKTVDSLYTSLKKSIVLSPFNSLYPISNDIEAVFEQGKGDASDLSYIMYKILDEWEQKVNVVWIRDKRQGMFEDKVPTRIWFDRLGLKVTIGKQSKFYDFDRSIPTQYELPWYLDKVNLIVLNEDGYTKEKINLNYKSFDNKIVESHKIKFNDTGLVDSLEMKYVGSIAQEFRKEYYESEVANTVNSLSEKLKTSCFDKIEVASINDFLNLRNVKINFKGISYTKLDAIEDNLILSFKNHSLSSKREEIFTTNRRSDFLFNAPFSIILKWDVDLPDGYSIVKDNLVNNTLKGPAKSSSKISYFTTGNNLLITAVLKFPETTIPYIEFPKLIEFIDKNLNNLESGIVLKKIE